jgi:catechol 2,3-dioxygenase-like lactoylglutathione lyase family enzyme
MDEVRWGRRVATVKRMAIQRMENVGIVVNDLAAATAFFVELGLELQGEGTAEGDWVDRVVGLEGVRTEVAMLETPDGHGRLELMKFHTRRPGAATDMPRRTLWASAVSHSPSTTSTPPSPGCKPAARSSFGQVERYEDSYRLCYVRGPEGIIVMLAEQIG